MPEVINLSGDLSGPSDFDTYYVTILSYLSVW